MGILHSVITGKPSEPYCFKNMNINLLHVMWRELIKEPCMIWEIVPETLIKFDKSKTKQNRCVTFYNWLSFLISYVTEY